MRRNRLITILLCMTLTISAFTGCGKKDTVAEAEPEAQTEKNYVNSTEFVVEPTETAAETEEAVEAAENEEKYRYKCRLSCRDWYRRGNSPGTGGGHLFKCHTYR